MQEFKSIVRSCYKYLGQENLLGGAAEPEFKAKVNIAHEEVQNTMTTN